MGIGTGLAEHIDQLAYIVTLISLNRLFMCCEAKSGSVASAIQKNVPGILQMPGTGELRFSQIVRLTGRAGGGALFPDRPSFQTMHRIEDRRQVYPLPYRQQV